MYLEVSAWLEDLSQSRVLSIFSMYGVLRAVRAQTHDTASLVLVGVRACLVNSH